eukprot:EG_transcript_29257
MFDSRHTFNPTGRPVEDYDESQLKPRHVSRHNQQTEEAPQAWKPRAYNPNRETPVDCEEPAKPLRRMGYSTGQETEPTATAPPRFGRKLFSPDENGNLKSNVTIKPSSAPPEEPLRTAKKVGYEAASRLGVEESPSKQMGARAHTAGHNMHNTGYNGFCYSSSECGQPPERPAPLFQSALPVTDSPQKVEIVARGGGNRHTKLW